MAVMSRRILIGVLAALAAVSFGVASAIHAGLAVPVGLTTIRDRFDGAFVPEAVIGAVMAVGAVAVLTGRRRGRVIGLAATCFALLGTAYGLSVTARRGPAGDIAYHVTVLLLLLAIVTLLGTGRRASGTSRSLPG
jgi:hypothetical protein